MASVYRRRTRHHMLAAMPVLSIRLTTSSTNISTITSSRATICRRWPPWIWPFNPEAMAERVVTTAATRHRLTRVQWARSFRRPVWTTTTSEPSLLTTPATAPTTVNNSITTATWSSNINTRRKTESTSSSNNSSKRSCHLKGICKKEIPNQTNNFYILEFLSLMNFF